jgi:putative SOS response-associated peptidase YedK
MRDIHHRMPVILEPGSWNNWLIGRPLDLEDQRRLLAPSPDNSLSHWPVGGCRQCQEQLPLTSG